MKLGMGRVPVITVLIFLGCVGSRGDGCPQGVPVIMLSGSQTSSASNENKNASMTLRPRVYATPLQVPYPNINSSFDGVWASDGRWQLCIVIPPDAVSLTIIFSEIQLPLGASLEINGTHTGSNTDGIEVNRQVLTAWTVRGASGGAVTKPIAGNAALLTLSCSDPSSKCTSSNIVIDTVLQGVRPVMPKSFTREEAGSALNTTVADILVARINNQSSMTLACLVDAACYPSYTNATRAAVLLLLASPSGGRTCTGSLLAGPDPADQLIVTANHCREDDDPLTVAMLWSVAFGVGNSCSNNQSSSGSSVQSTPGVSSSNISSSGSTLNGNASPNINVGLGLVASEIFQGLQIVWSDEISDVLLLRLNNEIPERYRPFYLGWDASRFPMDSSGSGAVHFAGGGPSKKLTTTSRPLTPAMWKIADYTHVIAHWTMGVTQEGSSGASLINDTSGLSVGVLTGGPDPTSCAKGADMFGTFNYAFQHGLDSVLGGPGNVSSMAGYDQVYEGPGLLTVPGEVVLREGTIALPVISLKLSDPPVANETITAKATLVQTSSGAGKDVNITLLPPATFNFTEDTWNTSQSVSMIAGSNAVPSGPRYFQVIFDMTSDINASFHKRRIVQGLSIDQQAPSGYTAQFPAEITGGSNGIDGQDSGQLLAANSVNHVAQGDLIVNGNPLGATMFYNISAGETIELNIAACSSNAALLVVVYNNSQARWFSTADCSSENASNCMSVDNSNGCSGFLGLVLPGVGNLPPYTVALSTKRAGIDADYTLRVMQTSSQGNLYGDLIGLNNGGRKLN